jgi:ApaG protein
MTQSSNNYDIDVQVKTQYIPEQSNPARNRFVFAFHVTITNQGRQSAQLLNRQWIITNGNGKTQEVSGTGVIGQQPIIKPGQQHAYTSGTVLETSVGSMRGHYGMQAADGHTFIAHIPAFTLAYPHALH